MAFQSKVTHHFMITATRERIHCLSPGICWGVADQGPVPGAESRVSRADTTRAARGLRHRPHLLHLGVSIAATPGHPDPWQPCEAAALGPCSAPAPPSLGRHCCPGCQDGRSCRVPGFLLGRKGAGLARWLQRPAPELPAGTVLSPGGRGARECHESHYWTLRFTVCICAIG